MKIPIVTKAVESARGKYSPDDYSMLQLMAEVGESDPNHQYAVGAYALFQMYTGSLGYWTYEGNSPFMGLRNLPQLFEFVEAIGWTELQKELQAVAEGLKSFSQQQLDEYASFTLDEATHRKIDAITFAESITDLVRTDDENRDGSMFRKACLFLESSIEFLEFDDAAALKAWRAAR